LHETRSFCPARFAPRGIKIQHYDLAFVVSKFSWLIIAKRPRATSDWSPRARAMRDYEQAG
jgi:hypothetical protein